MKDNWLKIEGPDLLVDFLSSFSSIFLFTRLLTLQIGADYLTIGARHPGGSTDDRL